MAENKQATDGIAEDLIRSFVQLASAEMHAKTLLEKRDSELTNGFVPDEKVDDHLVRIEATEQELELYTQLRREVMSYLFTLYSSEKETSEERKVRQEYWCTVKHLAIAMMTAFEAWQASDNVAILEEIYLRINKQFIKAVSQFLGVDITDCAACFSDSLKGGLKHGTA